VSSMPALKKIIHGTHGLTFVKDPLPDLDFWNALDACPVVVADTTIVTAAPQGTPEAGCLSHVHHRRPRLGRAPGTKPGI
jgi:hypothetical protein